MLRTMLLVLVLLMMTGCASRIQQLPPQMNLPNSPSLQLCEAMEVVSGEPPEELAADVRNINRYVDCQKRVFEWVGWYKEVSMVIGK